MAAIINGVNSAAIRQIEQRLESDRFGVDMLTLVEEVPAGVPFRAMGSNHPDFPAMAIARRSGQRGVGNLWRVSYLYEGFITALPQPTYELSGSLDQQPIETHPNFSDIAGTPSDPANGAVFIDPSTGEITEEGDLGVFREFKSTLGGSPNPKAGVDSYMDPGATWTEISFSLTQPSLGSLGDISSPAGPNPSMGGRNWLFWEVNSRRRGHIIEVRKTWKLSGRGGWDTDIY